MLGRTEVYLWNDTCRNQSDTKTGALLRDYSQPCLSEKMVSRTDSWEDSVLKVLFSVPCSVFWDQYLVSLNYVIFLPVAGRQTNWKEPTQDTAFVYYWFIVSKCSKMANSDAKTMKCVNGGRTRTVSPTAGSSLAYFLFRCFCFAWHLLILLFLQKFLCFKRELRSTSFKNLMSVWVFCCGGCDEPLQIHRV